MGYENEKDSERQTRMKAYWDDQMALNVEKTDDTLKDIMDYIKENQGKDPMLVPGLVTKYDTPVSKGGGCVVS
eukprot:CAMPEP_0174695204 /NCGR_PEP_ID=MMETSP1094-20130205/1640_1 /TAXON_ID=156173 /ORGANISM="Chrysochromulina brevifilum, Strain UTEX LB 985" /LENGTH=72 /DNA_ID=CAMNT_0015891649 /DNA_START=36 /DNA_END=254 /DNA_ORIENTATION=-